MRTTKYNATFYLETEPLPKLVCERCGGYIPCSILATPRGVTLCQCEPEGPIVESTAQALPLETEDMIPAHNPSELWLSPWEMTAKQMEKLREEPGK